MCVEEGEHVVGHVLVVLGEMACSIRPSPAAVMMAAASVGAESEVLVEFGERYVESRSYVPSRLGWGVLRAAIRCVSISLGPSGRKEVYLGDVRLQYCELGLFRQKLFLEWKLLYFVVLVCHCCLKGDGSTLGLV